MCTFRLSPSGLGAASSLSLDAFLLPWYSKARLLGRIFFFRFLVADGPGGDPKLNVRTEEGQSLTHLLRLRLKRELVIDLLTPCFCF